MKGGEGICCTLQKASATEVIGRAIPWIWICFLFVILLLFHIYKYLLINILSIFIYSCSTKRTLFVICDRTCRELFVQMIAESVK